MSFKRSLYSVRWDRFRVPWGLVARWLTVGGQSGGGCRGINLDTWPTLILFHGGRVTLVIYFHGHPRPRAPYYYLDRTRQRFPERRRASVNNRFPLFNRGSCTEPSLTTISVVVEIKRRGGGGGKVWPDGSRMCRSISPPPLPWG